MAKRVMKIFVTKIEGTCAFEGCRRKATYIACAVEGPLKDVKPGREPKCYCDVHAMIVQDENGPEYINRCPNCGCIFGEGE